MCMHTYTLPYIYTHTCVYRYLSLYVYKYAYVYIYIEREREREREKPYGQCAADTYQASAVHAILEQVALVREGCSFIFEALVRASRAGRARLVTVIV